MFHPCILIPVYNHKDAIPGVVEGLECFGLPVLLVDDGSDEATRLVLEDLARKEYVQLKRLALNGGKGQAVKAGLLWAGELGFSHALQIDSDGQHRSEDIPRFLKAAENAPQALILGTPVFGEDVPKSRLYGRQVSKILVHLETLSKAIHDPLFGFRVYPTRHTTPLLSRRKLPNRMDFDPEVVVKLVWAGAPVVNLPTPVSYPTDGISHFQMFRDNLRISWMHTRLITGMILRLPILLGRRFR